MLPQGRLVAILLLLLAFGIGCSSGRNPNAPATVSGKITYKGQLVKGGTIAFIAKEAKGAYTSGIRSDGTYHITDLPVGAMEVTIETESVNPNLKKKSYGKKGAPSPMPSSVKEKGTDPADFVQIPPRYGDRTNSKLTATLVAGTQTKDFDLTD